MEFSRIQLHRTPEASLVRGREYCRQACCEKQYTLKARRFKYRILLRRPQNLPSTTSGNLGGRQLRQIGLGREERCTVEVETVLQQIVVLVERGERDSDRRWWSVFAAGQRDFHLLDLGRLFGRGRRWGVCFGNGGNAVRIKP